METKYKYKIYFFTLIMLAFTSLNVKAANINSNAPTDTKKATLLVKFANGNKSVQIKNTNKYKKPIQQVVLNLADGNQEIFTEINKKAVNLRPTGINANTMIIGVWVANEDNSAKSIKDSSGYGDYIKNNDKKTFRSPYHDFQTDRACAPCQADDENCTVNKRCKVKICHIPPGNPENRHTIWISCSALQAHIRNHGDNEGECEEGGGGVIPVELISFNANVLTPNMVELKWVTASEVNNDYFAIEKTSDLANWEPVCKVHGKGNSNEINHYSCTDSSAGESGSNTVYYRPKQVDFNGTYEYFNIIKIRLESQNGTNYVENIYPNPATDRINIQYNAAENGIVNIRLLSIEGKAILASRYSAQAGQQVVDLDLPEDKLAKGMYILEVENDGQYFRQKVYKQ